MRTLKADFKFAFGNKFLDFQEGQNNEFWLYLDDQKFTAEYHTTIIQFGFAYHVGFVMVELVGHLKPHLRVKLKKY